MEYKVLRQWLSLFEKILPTHKSICIRVCYDTKELGVNAIQVLEDTQLEIAMRTNLVMTLL